MCRVADDDNPPAHVAGASARKMADVVAHQLAGCGGGYDGPDPRCPACEVLTCCDQLVIERGAFGVEEFPYQ